MRSLQNVATGSKRKGIPGSLAWLEHPAFFAAASPILTLLGAGTTMIAPRLLDPVAFGAFALVTVLFQYTAAADLGLSRLADRRIAAQGLDDGDEISRALWRIAVIIAASSPVVALWAWQSGALPPVAAGFAVLAGAAFIAGEGPVSVNRASARIGDFALFAMALQFGTTLPRLSGLLAGGITGCFAVMAVYYVGFALLFCRPRPGAPPRLGPLVASGLPLFAFYGVWLAYSSANRWAAWAVSKDETEFGLFAFGATFPFIAAGVISNISQVRYPRVIVNLAASPSAGAKAVATDILWLSVLAAAAIAVAIPFAAQAIEAVFPRFSAAEPSAIALAVSGIPLAIVAWTLPLCISLSHRPWRNALAVFGAPLLLLAPAMWVGERTAGLVGQAWGSTLDAWLLAALQVVALRQVGALTPAGAIRSVLLPTALAALLCAVIATAHAEPAVSACRPQMADRTFNDEFQRLQLWNNGVGDRLDRYWATVHWRSDNGSAQEKSFLIPTPDLSEAFHDFGVEWGPARIRWTFDGRIVAETSAPPGANKPVYLLVNLAVGGKWPGDPDATTIFPASLRVQRASAYRLAGCMERDQ